MGCYNPPASGHLSFFLVSFSLLRLSLCFVCPLPARSDGRRSLPFPYSFSLLSCRSPVHSTAEGSASHVGRRFILPLLRLGEWKDRAGPASQRQWKLDVSLYYGTANKTLHQHSLPLRLRSSSFHSTSSSILLPLPIAQQSSGYGAISVINEQVRGGLACVAFNQTTDLTFLRPRFQHAPSDFAIRVLIAIVVF